MSKRRIKIPTPTWEHESTGITRKLEANRWQLWATVGIILLVVASLSVVGWSFLSDYIEDQQRPGSLGLRVADRELTVSEYSHRAILFAEEVGTRDAGTIIGALNEDLIEEAILLQFADERSVTASEDEIRAEIASRLGIAADDPNFDARLGEELTRIELSEEGYTDLARADVLGEKMLAAFQSEAPDALPSVNYRQIQVADQETADDLIAQLDEGADFATLADEHSLILDEAAAEAIWVPEGILDPLAEGALFALDVNEVKDYVASDSVFIFQLLEKSDSQEVAQDHRDTLGRVAYGEWLTDKRAEIDIENELDPQTGDGDKIGYVINHANLSVPGQAAPAAPVHGG